VWKKKYSGLALNELRELRQLREENGKPKRLSRTVTGFARALRRHGGQQRALYVTFALMGWRPREMFGLCWDSVDTRNLWPAPRKLNQFEVESVACKRRRENPSLKRPDRPVAPE
jgi:hypothetical protein